MEHKEGETFTTQESTELLQHIATNMVTKEDVRVIVTEVVKEMVPPMITKANDELREYIDKKDREYKGELNLSLQKEDKKVDAVIDALQEQKVIDATKSEELKSFKPFPSIPPVSRAAQA